MLENVSVDVVDGARVKGVLGVSVRPRSQGRGFKVCDLGYLRTATGCARSRVPAARVYNI